jgi:predicted phage baseplate assembly protein
MPLTAPILDDRTFEELFKEARARIPRYVPEWTDWNDSDPGITLLQLQAWLTETILYRLNQLPDLNYVKFLQLIGVEQRPARPATTELTFTLKERDVPAAVLIEAGQVVSVSARDLERPVLFETDRAFRAISARLALLVRVAPTADATPTDVTQDNAASGRAFAPFGDPPEAGAMLLLGFESSLPFPREEIGLQLYQPDASDALLAPRLEEACDARLPGASAPALAWEYWDGVGWQALDVSGDETEGLTQSGQVYLRVPGQISRVPFDALGLGTLGEAEADPPLYAFLRVRLIAPAYTSAPRIDRIVTNTVRATAARTVRDEAVGSSDGTPDQSLTLRHAPVLAEPALRLDVDEGRGPEPWQVVPDFAASGADDAHYVLDRGAGRIAFGDGRRGRIPLAGQLNVIARSYRHGGGTSGNVGAGTITDLVTPIREVEAVTNLRRVESGSDEEPLAEARLRGPRELLVTRNRAVTLADFEHLARETPGALVARARAYLSLGADDAHLIEVAIVPRSSDPKPVPSAATRRRVCRHLDERRLITTRLRVRGPHYHDIDVDIDLVVDDGADLKTVKNAVDARLTDYFHPLRGGRDEGGWPFGRAVYYSELLHEIMRMGGVHRVADAVVKKFLRRPDGPDNPEERPYFDTAGQAHAHQHALIEAEIRAFAPACAELEPVVITIADPPEAQHFVAAAYACCDVPVAEGALPALRRLRTSVRYAH